MAQSDTLTARLTELVRDRPAAAHDLVQAERYLRDWIGSLAAGGATPAGAILRDYARDRTDLEGRVFLAAALSHITESDDLHRGSITHPGCVVVPTALLLGRRNGADGRRILHAVLVGYEVMLRVGEALGPGHYEVFHNTATAGVFGSAAAAAHLLELDESGWISALGNAGTQAAGLWQFNQDATMSKHLHAGHAAQAGLRAALLAGHGFTGPAAILEGEKGFFRGFCPDPAPGRVLAPATNWKLAETSFKPYPSCRHTHPAIDAALEIRRRIRSPADAVERITSVRIWTYPAALRLTDNPAPSSSYAAKFSIQFCVATALVHGAPGLAAFEGNRLSDPRVRDVAVHSTVGVRQDLAATYPHRWGAALTVSTEAHPSLTAECNEPRGDPEAPLSSEDLDGKVVDLFAYASMGAARAEEALRASKNLPEGGPAFDLPWLDDPESLTGSA